MNTLVVCQCLFLLEMTISCQLKTE
jgi:hypothetical protein